MPTNVLTLVGSLRQDSTNRKLATALAEHAPAGTDVTVAAREALSDLPFYDEDLEANGPAPEAVRALRDAVAGADALLIVTPEYNGTLPAVVKNAIDWLSRPYGQGVIKGVPAAVVGTSMGQYGGVWAHDHGRLALQIAGAEVVDRPRLELGHVHRRFAEVDPRDDAEVAEAGQAVLSALTAAVTTVSASA